MPCGSDAEGLGLHEGQLLGAGEGYWDELAPEITSLLASSLPMLFPQFLDPFLLEASVPIKLLAPKCSSYTCIFKLTFKT